MDKLKLISKVILSLVMMISVLSTGAFNTLNDTLLDSAKNVEAATLERELDVTFSGILYGAGDTWSSSKYKIKVYNDNIYNEGVELRPVVNGEYLFLPSGTTYQSSNPTSFNKLKAWLLGVNNGYYLRAEYEGGVTMTIASTGGSCGASSVDRELDATFSGIMFGAGDTWSTSKYKIKVYADSIYNEGVNLYTNYNGSYVNLPSGNFLKSSNAANFDKVKGWLMSITNGYYINAEYSGGVTFTIASTGGGSCTTAPPVTTTVYPTTCASGLTPKGTPGTSSFYCEKPTYITSCPSGMTLTGSGASAYCKQSVKQTEYTNPDFVKDINLGDLIGNMGDYGSTGDNKLDISGTDSGTHNNGWHLNGAGEAYKSNHVQFTNVPDNGYINAIGESWSPKFMITQGKVKLDVPIKEGSTTAERQKWDKSLSDYKATNNTTEVIAYTVTNLDELKTIQESEKGLIDLFTKNGSTYKHGNRITYSSVTSAGINDLDKLKINQGGYYILATKYVDLVSAKKEQPTPSQDTVDKYTYYSFVPVNISFMADLSYLPIYNNLLAQVNDTMLVSGNKKSNHKLNNLEYKTYGSLKVPSAYDNTSGKTLIGSTTGGLQLTDSKMNAVTIIGETALASSAKVNDIVEYSNGFYIATNGGVLYLNCEDNSLNKTIITEPVNDILLSHNAMHILTDTTLRVAFVGEGELIMSSKEYDLKELFSDASVKAGRIEEVNGLLNISSKDDGSLSEVITFTK